MSRRCDRTPCVAGGPHQAEHLVHPAVIVPAAPAQPAEARQGDAPPIAVEAEADHIDPADAEPRVEAAALREIPDAVARLAGREAQDPGGAAGQRHEAEQRLHKGGLAGPVGADDRDELPTLDREVDARPHPMAADGHGRIDQFRHRPRGPVRNTGDPLGHRVPAHRPVAAVSAVSSERSWPDCQSWNVAVGGSRVSVIVVIGMPASLASLTWVATSGVEFWLLTT
jgi:hypothetical protein